MKMTKKKANQIKGLFATLNAIEISKLDSNNLSGVVCTQFDCEISFSVYPSCTLISDKITWRTDYNLSKVVPATYSGWHQPSAVYLYDDACKYEEFDAVVRFARAAIRAGGLDKLKYGTIKVVSEMTDYLNFDIKDPAKCKN